ncbi:MAG: phosphatase PAP2 family protein [Acidimicrobiales bacterium]
MTEVKGVDTPSPSSQPARPPMVRLYWWKEAALVLGFYAVYTTIRNQFGSARVSSEVAYDNAELVIDIEQALGSFHEEEIQSWFLDWDWFLWFWNVFYGTFHFGVTIFALVWLYRRFPERYPRWRNTFAITTAAALIGFATFPLMPPRLLPTGPPYGGARFGGDQYQFVDTLADVGGLWSFDSGTMQEVSNQYAAMPSLHFAWATFCAVAVIPTLTNRWGRAALALYPVATLFAIVVTGNHYWIDALGGLVVLGFGYLVGTRSADWWRRRQIAKSDAAEQSAGRDPGTMTPPSIG